MSTSTHLTYTPGNIKTGILTEFVKKLQEHFSCLKVFYWSYYNLQVNFDRFVKWEEIKEEKGYTDREIMKYFIEWLIWKYPKKFKHIKTVTFIKDKKDHTIYHFNNGKSIYYIETDITHYNGFRRGIQIYNK